VMAYTHAQGAEVGQAIEGLHEHVESGYRAVRLQCGVPGLPSVYGVYHGQDEQPGAGYERPFTESWESAAYLRVVPTLFEAARDAVGFDTHLL
ncbi:bifunctional D-altronate/D-mannonate dehydratase, partial [Klebsiella michiganensis]